MEAKYNAEAAINKQLVLNNNGLKNVVAEQQAKISILEKLLEKSQKNDQPKDPKTGRFTKKRKEK